MHQPVQDRAGHRRIPQILAPVLHHPVGGHHHGAAKLVALVNNRLQNFCRLRRDSPGQKQIVHDQQIRPDPLPQQIRSVLAVRMASQAFDFILKLTTDPANESRTQQAEKLVA